MSLSLLIVFRNIHRQRVSPFSAAPQLALRPEFEYLAPKVLDKRSSYSSKSDSDTSKQSCSQSNIEEGEYIVNSVEQSDTFDHQAFESDVEEQFRAKMFTAIEYWDEQRARGHYKFVEEFMKKNKDNIIMVDEIQQLKDQRSMPKTWASYKNPLKIYYV